MKYFASVRYVGCRFCGFQVQKNGRTVQGVLTDAAARLFGVPVRVSGCSRTDSGVHAEAFCLTIEPQEGGKHIPPEALPLAILPYLPDDLALLSAKEAPEGFHPRYSVLGKEYVYRIRFGRLPDPFLRGRVTMLTRPLPENALEAMQKAAALLVGTHDFSSFMHEDAEGKSTVRTISSFTVKEEGELLEFSVFADGFLYNMVRICVGTLLEVGYGERTLASVEAALAGHDRTLSGITMPPDGLYLKKVVYQPPFHTLLFGE